MRKGNALATFLKEKYNNFFFFLKKKKKNFTSKAKDYSQVSFAIFPKVSTPIPKKTEKKEYVSNTIICKKKSNILFKLRKQITKTNFWVNSVVSIFPNKFYF